jgi:uncharacterized protein YggU (UPF0235/DUF167 family)
MDAVLHVTVKPRAPRTEVLRTDEGVLVRVTAPPVEGAANAAVIAALSDALHIPKSRLAVTGGASARAKRIGIRDLTAEDLAARVAALPTARS